MERGVVFINAINSRYATLLATFSGQAVFNREHLDAFDRVRESAGGVIPYILCINPSEDVLKLKIPGWGRRDFSE
ncbi:hypothetical protein FJZ17_04015 [Candidatus Pacearchaeota archaeon]|nr:hypothetical protein [Candidatus Pacearchaeota archaeon]